MRYKVELIKSDEGYAVGCPELPGCWSQGETREKAIRNIRLAIKDYISVQPTKNCKSEVDFIDLKDLILPPNGENGSFAAAERKPFDFGPLELNLPREWTSHKVENLLDILEGPGRP